MGIGKHIVLCVALFAAALATSACEPLKAHTGGVLDLQKWDVDRDGPAQLNGQWEFYWKRYLLSEDFRKEIPGVKKHLVDVPRIWNYYRLPGLGPLKHGYATYRLVVTLPKDRPPLGLKMVEINTACRIYANGILLRSGGTPGTSEEDTAPGYVTGVVPLDIAGDTLELVLHVANYHYLRGGVTEIFSIGSLAELTKKQDKAIALDFFLFGSLLIMSLYHLGAYLLRRKDASYLYFTLFCFFICIRIPSSGINILALHYPDVPWFIVYKLRFMSFPALPCFFLFIHAIFKKYSLPTINTIILVPCLAIGASVFTVPMSVQGYLMVPFMYTTLATSAYVLFILGRAALRRDYEAYIVLTGFIILFVAIFNDLLYETYRINLMVNILPFGVFLFILTQSFVLSLRFSRTFNKIEQLSDELQQKNQTLLQLDRMKDDFLASTSHELRTPLAGMIGIAEAMLDHGEVLNAQTRTDLRVIVSSGKRLSSLVTGILDFSRLKHDTIELHRSRVDMRLAVAEIFSVLQPLVAGKSVELVNRVPEGDAMAFADRDRMQQILYNLIGNALKFTMRGSVAVEAAHVGNMIEVVVADTGIGIPADRVSAVFEPYIQADDSISRQFGGTGLGLAITRMLVELHGGTIGVVTHLGEGTTIRFTVPAYTDQAAAQASDGPAAAPTATARRLPDTAPPDLHANEPVEARTSVVGSVLVVDDEPVNIIVLQRILEAQGHVVHSATNGAAALEFIERKEPNLVILDIMMPGMSGYEVAEAIRRKYLLPRLPILMVSARSNRDDIVHGFNCGINDYISKPFDRNELVARVGTLLEMRHGYLMREKLSTISMDLAVARNLQKTILTKRDYYRGIREVDIEVLYLPANNRISGDYYNVHRYADGTTALFLADATGHGIQAALFTSQIDVLNKNSVAVMDPAEKLSRINESLITEIGTNNYFTALSVFVSGGRLRYAGAGHHEQLVYRASTGAFETLVPKGILIGIVSGADYVTKTSDLSPGDALILFTDGVYDVEYHDGRRIIPMGDLASVLDGIFGGPACALGAQALCEGILRWFNDRGREVVYNDDITFIIMKMR